MLPSESASGASGSAMAATTRGTRTAIIAAVNRTNVGVSNRRSVGAKPAR
jgi:hypothetical protein